ncbi:Biopolymer transport protein ExbD [Posidoniimonas polymericola]|uniref:Biopolymer transport protein ExbD n=1 Tax=Posidoniimonas polymericola TaxID=2528002 RepID=A0A5C5YDC6_9BACT|nr:biopolymer transporter ExbD [Posidoniimonas polymericola]TWT72793.1 Biopolymer transport protein ExbD [Posidoniimonas polymericola]
MAVKLNKGLSAGALSMTPLIDVVFLLLIFFLVASRFEQEERQMDVTLPQAAEAAPTVFPGQEVFVTVTPDGTYYIAGEKLSANMLRTRLKALYQANPGKQKVTIRADSQSNSGALVTVLDACNQANIRNYSIATE